MAETDYKKYWFIKLPREFFNRHDIKVLESMPNGKDYTLFYLKLLLESITHNGELRFNETIPYDENMLSVVTNTNIDVVRSAMKVLYELKLIELWDNQTIFMTEVNKMIGVETGSAIRKREYREKQKGTLSHDCPQEIELDIEKELEKEINNDLKTNKLSNINIENTCKKENINYNESNEDDTPSNISLRQVTDFIQYNELDTLTPYKEWIHITTYEIEDWKSYLLNKNKDR